MREPGIQRSRYGLENHGIVNVNDIYWNLSTPALYEEAVRRREGLVAHLGPLIVRTGHHTGRSPNDKFIVREPSSQDNISSPFMRTRCSMSFLSSGGSRSTPLSPVSGTNASK